MAKFVLQRLATLLPVMLGISVIVFFFIHLIPGDPAAVMAGDYATPGQIAELRTALGLDESLPTQYLRYAWRLLHGDLGSSIHTRNPIASELATRLPASMELALSAMLIAIVIGIPAGIVSATKRGSLVDAASMGGALIGVSMPVYVLGLIAMWMFAFKLGWLPVGGRLAAELQVQRVTGFLVLDGLLTGNYHACVDAVKHLLVPAMTLSTVPMAIIARITRSSLLDCLSQDYIRTARGKGLAEPRIVIRHALKNGMLPVVTVIGLQIGVILSGAVLTETIFSWPGIGRWVYEAITKRDYPVIQGMTLFIGVVFLFTSLLVDCLYALLDPRIRYD
jgi:peptide/nickel transport system permease protein